MPAIPRASGALAGRVVLVAGGANGMGAAEVRRFVAEGAGVVVGDVADHTGKQLVEEVGDGAVYCHLDVCREDDWAAALALGASTFGRPVTGMVNNAAIGRVSTIEATTLDEYLDVIMVNQVGVFLGIQACIPGMRQAGAGSIVTISSILGLGGHTAFGPYVSAKYAIRGLSRVAALELAGAGIRVNTICPGAVDTQMLRAGDEDPAALGPIARQVPLKAVASPAEIAKAALFLLSEESSYITGADLVVDGGVMARVPLSMAR